MFDSLAMALADLQDIALDLLDFLRFSLLFVIVVLSLGLVYFVSKSIISDVTAVPVPLPEKPLPRRERRAIDAAARRSSARRSSPSSASPIIPSDYELRMLAERNSPRRPPVVKRFTPSYPNHSCIDDIVAKRAAWGFKPRFTNGLVVEWVPIAPKGALLVPAEMVAATRRSTRVVAASADVATDTTPRAGPDEPPQCRGAASAADAGRARVQASTEGLVSQVAEPPQGDNAASAVNPGCAGVPVSTDGSARPIVLTWSPSSGPIFLPPRAPHPLFMFRNWKPSTGVEYHPRPPHPLFATAFASPTPLPRPVPEVVVSPPSPPRPSPLPPEVLSSPTPAPAPRHLPTTLAPVLSAATMPSSAPAAGLSRPPRHPGSLTAAASLARAPILPAAPATAPAPASAAATARNNLATQNWLAPLVEILALDIQKLGLTEDQLMAWETQSLKPAKKSHLAEEALAQQCALTMAERFGAIARDLKRAGVLFRLQLQRVPGGRFPAHNQFHKIFTPLHEASKAFVVLQNAGRTCDDADFDNFKNAVRFFSHHVLTMSQYEACLVHHDGEVEGKRKANKIKDAAMHVSRFLGIQQPKVLQRPGLA